MKNRLVRGEVLSLSLGTVRGTFADYPYTASIGGFLMNELWTRLRTKSPFRLLGGPRDRIKGEEVRVENGRILPPDGTGEGVDLDHEGETFAEGAAVDLDGADDALKQAEKLQDLEPAPELADDVRDDSPAAAAVGKSTVGRLPKIEKFWDYLKVGNRGSSTIQAYRYDYVWWQRVAAGCGTSSVYTLSVTQMEAALADLHPSTRRRKTASLRTLGKFYLRQDFPRLYAETDKLLSPKLPERLPRDRGAAAFIVLRGQAKELCLNGQREGVWIGLMLLAGLRISEIRTAVVTEDGYVRVLGKGSKERLVSTVWWLRDAMQSISRDGKRHGWALGRKSIWQGLSDLAIRNPHSLRHTYASQLVREGVALEHVQILLGHKKFDTTLGYAKLTVPDVAALLDRESEEEK